jgi:hypothetical protein
MRFYGPSWVIPKRSMYFIGLSQVITGALVFIQKVNHAWRHAMQFYFK